jgi:phosphonate transport system ATP-binding protein
LQSLFHRVPRVLRDRGLRAIEALGLAGKEHEPVYRLSGGQQRRVAVARALVQRPRLLLADEFLSELDPATVDAVVASVRSLQAETHMAILLVEHQLEEALRIADRVYRLKGGVLEVMA